MSFLFGLFGAEPLLSEIPQSGKMKRLVLVEPNDDITKAKFEIETVNIPKPKRGEVLIKVYGAPVNPSDYGDWKNKFHEGKRVPVGKEGSGLVVGSGGGPMANKAVGKKCGFTNNTKTQGSYSEYITLSALEAVFTMPDELEKIEDAASFFVNPYTAYALVDIAKSKNSPGLVHTAAASQLGQMMNKLVLQQNDGFQIINVVRKQEQVDTLKEIGAKHIINSSENGWEDKLKDLIKELKITCAMDAIAGEMTGTLLSMLPPKGGVWVYGVLSKQPVGNVEPIDLIYRKKTLNGFFLTTWVMNGGAIKTLVRLNAAGAIVNEGIVNPNGWARSKFVDCTLETMQEKFNEMFNGGGFTNTKLRINFNQ